MAGNEKIASPLNRAAVRTLSGKLVHDVRTVDHSFTSISELVWRKASVQFESKAPCRSRSTTDQQLVIRIGPEKALHVDLYNRLSAVVFSKGKGV